MKFFRSSTTGRWRMFNARPIDGYHPDARWAVPVWNGRWWDRTELLVEITTLRQVDPSEAGDEVLALPWYRQHACTQIRTTHDDVSERSVPA